VSQTRNFASPLCGCFQRSTQAVHFRFALEHYSSVMSGGGPNIYVFHHPFLHMVRRYYGT
jgi:hypothetical protein